MKTKNLILTLAATIGLTVLTPAQNLPTYLPANGLLGWWPFNGAADDESGNGNNGTVNGSILTEDRFSNANSAFNFDGVDDFINVGFVEEISGSAQLTISYWINSPIIFPDNPAGNYGTVIGHWKNDGQFSGPIGYQDAILSNGSYAPSLIGAQNGVSQLNLIQPNVWQNIIVIFNGDLIPSERVALYINGVFSQFINVNNAPNQIGTEATRTYFGAACGPDGDDDAWSHFNGMIDDIGIWNRALTLQEISDLFNAVNCANNTTITPQTNSLTIGSTATFSAITSDTNPSYVWQSNFGQGFQTLIDIENYSGTNTNTLSISNVQLANHNVPIRVISTAGECIDTSEVVTVSILDTCILLINDTTFITVTDTLLINTLITGINPPNNSNIIKVFPNPANSHITIDYGDFAIMTGYQLRIENSIGQEIFQTSITQQIDYLNLENWGGNGLYFMYIVDPQGNTIDIRKIVLQ